MATVEEKIGYKFSDKDILMQALTHSSFANERGIPSNERLEFLGDSVLSLVTVEYLYKNFPEMPEGQLTLLKKTLVCSQSLASFARELELGDYIFLGKGETKSGGATRQALLEDSFEALTGAIYLDGGLECAREFVLRFICKAVETHNTVFTDYKSRLQELIQQNPDVTLNYVITGERGPQHMKTYVAEIHINSNVFSHGSGKSKKAAEQAAAREALELMGVN